MLNGVSGQGDEGNTTAEFWEDKLGAENPYGVDDLGDSEETQLAEYDLIYRAMTGQENTAMEVAQWQQLEKMKEDAEEWATRETGNKTQR